VRRAAPLASLFLFSLIATWSAAQAGGEDPLSPLIQEKIEHPGAVSAIPCKAERACGSRIIREFYRKRAYQPVWSSAGRALPRARLFVEVLGSARDEGLRPGDYHYETVLRLFQQAFGDPARTSPDAAADFDLLLTNAFFVYGTHMLSGRVDPRDLFRNWSLDERGLDLSSVLEEVVQGRDLREALAALRPHYSAYVFLLAALSRYRAIEEAGGWPQVAMAEKRLERWDRSPAVDILRRRLQITGEFRDSGGSAAPDLFDDALYQAVRAFQARHGLTVDGVVGPKTLAALNVPVDARVRIMELNLERLRWLPETLGGRYLLLNIADFSLTAWEGGKKCMEMKAIVGRTQRQTPLLSSTIDTVILNPPWNVPHSIATKDLLPAIRKDPGMLVKKGFRVFRLGADAEEIDPSGIDWQRFSERNFPFRLRQDPGPANALGDMKFSFPNTESVYLHGTPAHNLFMKSRRDFSSGCIRIEDTLALAEWILDGQGSWNRDALLVALATGVTRSIPVRRPVPIHVLYLTAWAEPDGTAHFRPDIYGQDVVLARALGMGGQVL